MPNAHARTSTGTLAAPRIAQRYVVESEIARGGMGVVYKVREQASGTVYALKRIRLDAAANLDVLLGAFEREYQVLASLDHPGIIRVFDYGVDGDQPYYTMEFVAGRDLRQAAPMQWRDACRQLRDVASALSLLHARRLIHRDLSPGNVKITPQGRSKLLDFGALTDFGYPKWLVGTPPMISPELLAGGMLDQRTDLYALGALAYWVLTRRHAYPATRSEDLPAAWRHPPPPPSAYAADIPASLDGLVMSLLSANPLARPGSAAEVIAHLDSIAELAEEDDGERRRLAHGYLALPPFVGRDAQIEEIGVRLAALGEGRGGVLRLSGAPGSGRSRLLEEAGVRAQIAGAAVLRVDASMHPSAHGTSRALTLRVFEALPELAVRHGQTLRGPLGVLGKDVLAKLGEARSEEPAPVAAQRAHGEGELSDFFLAVSEAKPLVLQIDNLEYADDVSVGLLATLAREAPRRRLLLMLVERSDLHDPPSLGLGTLRELSSALSLPPLSQRETTALVRSMFGDAPDAEPFAEWLHQRAAGNPLLTVEVARQLVDRGDVRYEAGMWQLPVGGLDAHRTALLDDVLSGRIARLAPAALDLARCLGLSRAEATFALCARLSAPEHERAVRQLLDELVQHDVMRLEQGTYHFSSAALREVLLASTSDGEREASHQRLGRALLALAGDDPMLRIEAGWHLIRGGSDLQGAALIDAVMQNAVVMRRLNADMHRIGAPVEAALDVYKRQRRPAHTRIALLCALTHAGFFEDHRFDALYSDDTLDLLERLAGVQLARRLRWLGRLPALALGIALAGLRFYLLPKRERPFSFSQVLVQLFANVLASTAVAAIKLDGDRAARVADVLAPFAGLPRATTASSVYRFCSGLQHVAREHQVEAFREFEQFLVNLEHRRGFRLVPADGRVIFACAAHFARGAFAIFRNDGRAALESAAVLEASGLRVYAMVGSQLRVLYYLNRGQFAEAEQHRARVELHAAHFGSGWQVQTWEPAALLPLTVGFEDAIGVTRLARRLELAARTIPSLRRYARLARFAATGVRGAGERRMIERGEPDVASEVPRSFIGWSAALATLARAYGQIGEHERARRWCERALAPMSDDDREYVVLFLTVDLETALADAGLGRFDAAFARLDGLIARFQDGGNALTLGRLHETRARIAFRAGRVAEYERSLDEVRHWFGALSVPALVAKYERLVELQRPPDTARGRVLAANDNAPGADAPDLADLDTEV